MDVKRRFDLLEVFALHSRHFASSWTSQRLCGRTLLEVRVPRCSNHGSLL